MRDVNSQHTRAGNRQPKSCADVVLRLLVRGIEAVEGTTRVDEKRRPHTHWFARRLQPAAPLETGVDHMAAEDTMNDAFIDQRVRSEQPVPSLTGSGPGPQRKWRV